MARACLPARIVSPRNRHVIIVSAILRSTDCKSWLVQAPACPCPQLPRVRPWVPSESEPPSRPPTRATSPKPVQHLLRMPFFGRSRLGRSWKRLPRLAAPDLPRSIANYGTVSSPQRLKDVMAKCFSYRKKGKSRFSACTRTHEKTFRSLRRSKLALV